MFTKVEHDKERVEGIRQTQKELLEMKKHSG